MSDSVAEAILYEFAVVALKKYGDMTTAFKDFDINGNGTLSASEFIHHFKDLFEGDATAIFKALDQDRAGDICVKEFTRLETLHEQYREQQQKTMDAMDVSP